MRHVFTLLLAAAGLSHAAHAACWTPSLAVPTRAISTRSTQITVGWSALRPTECTAELVSFDHYRVELGAASAPTTAGAGTLLARIYDRDATVLDLQGLTAGATVYVAVFACDDSETCLTSADMVSHTLSTTMPSAAAP